MAWKGKWSQEDSRVTCTTVVDVIGACLAPLHWAGVPASQCRDCCLLMAQTAFFSWEVPSANTCYLTLNVWKIKSSLQEWCAVNLLAQGKITSWCHSLPVGPARLGWSQLAAENTSCDSSCLIPLFSLPFSENSPSINHLHRIYLGGPTWANPLSRLLFSGFQENEASHWNVKCTMAGRGEPWCTQGWPEQTLPLLIHPYYCSPELDQWFYLFLFQAKPQAWEKLLSKLCAMEIEWE